jgi:glycosyltransferase involved in cell wall biosynthesis
MYPGTRKLCLVTNRYPAHPDDTASPFVRDLHLALKRHRIEVVVHTPKYSAEKVEVLPEVHRFDWSGGERTVGELNLFSAEGLLQLYSFLTKGREALLDLVERERPTHCLALWALPSGWFANQVMQEFGIPYSVWSLGSDIYVWARKPVFKQLTKKILQEASHLFADGFDLAEKVTQLSGRFCRFLPSQRILPRVRPEINFELDQKFQNFLYIGRWEKSKGVEELLFAFRHVADHNPRVRLTLIGWGSLEAEMRNLLEKLSLTNFVKMVGKVGAPVLSSYLKNCDWVVIPSQGDSIPLVLSEALQFRKPVIVTEVGDLGMLTRKYGLGKVVRPNDPEDLASALIEIAREKQDYTRKMPELMELLSLRRAVEAFLQTVGWKSVSSVPRNTRTLAWSLDEA